MVYLLMTMCDVCLFLKVHLVFQGIFWTDHARKILYIMWWAGRFMHSNPQQTITKSFLVVLLSMGCT